MEHARDALVALEAKWAEALAAATSKIATLQASLPPSLVAVTRTLGQTKQFRDAMQEYETALPALGTKRAKLAKLNCWKGFITNVAQKFATAESTLADARITDIQASCQDLFGNLVRGGPDVRPTLNRAQNAGQVDIGEPIVRQYLEYKLGQIITRLKIPVPPDYAMRSDRRTLSTYIKAITDAVSLYQVARDAVFSRRNR